MRHSRSSRNPHLEDWSKRYQRRDNVAFFTEALGALARRAVGNGGVMVIGLLGQRDLPGHTLRTAQSVLRWDMRPSLWSHAFLIAARAVGRAAVNRAPVWEVALHPRNGEFPRPQDNGVGGLTRKGRRRGAPGVTLGDYWDPSVDANAALLAVRMSDEEASRVRDRAATPNIDRIRYDLWASLGVWQGYLWAQGARPNPLRDGVPIPSASYVEMVYEAINLDLTPGAAERHSAPEHLWNAACWWHQTFSQQGHSISGYYVLRDPGGSLMSADE